jgi:hypothetical protein
MLAPGDCSPSRKVVSKIRIMRVVMAHLSSLIRADENVCQQAFSSAHENTKAFDPL